MVNSDQIILAAFTGDQNFQLVFHAVLKVLDRKTEKHYYDLKVPFEVASILDEENMGRIMILQKEPVVYCIGHTHIDCAWMWTLTVTKDKAVRSFSTVLELMKNYPEYKFMSSQPQLYQYVKENAPEIYKQIKEQIRYGRWKAIFFTTYNGMLTPSEVMGSWKRYSQKALNKEVLCCYGYGDGGGGTTKEMLENQRRLEKYSMVYINQENVMTEVVKKSEASNEIILRLYEYFNKRTLATLSFGMHLLRVYECDMLENNEKELIINNNTVSITMKPYEIKTLKISVINTK